MSEQDNIKDFSNSVASLLGTLIGTLIAFALVACFGMWLWNACLVAVFPAIPEVTYLQFCGIYVLCNIMFSSRKLISKNNKK